MSKDKVPNIGLIDSGISTALKKHCLDGVFISISKDGDLLFTEALEDELGHGSAIAQSILDEAPQAVFLNAQVFLKEPVTTPKVVAAAFDWLRERGVRLINVSLGLGGDRKALRASVEAALSSGIIILASSPARGGPVFPASYSGVIRVCGDARCAEDELSALFTEQADFGAYAWPQGKDADGIPLIGGASFAAAKVSGIATRFLCDNYNASAEEVITHLQSKCSYFGPERRE